MGSAKAMKINAMSASASPGDRNASATVRRMASTSAATPFLNVFGDVTVGSETGTSIAPGPSVSSSSTVTANSGSLSSPVSVNSSSAKPAGISEMLYDATASTPANW